VEIVLSLNLKSSETLAEKTTAAALRQTQRESSRSLSVR
jgi:hypothetical protein